MTQSSVSTGSGSLLQPLNAFSTDLLAACLSPSGGRALEGSLFSPHRRAFCSSVFPALIGRYQQLGEKNIFYKLLKMKLQRLQRGRKHVGDFCSLLIVDLISWVEFFQHHTTSVFPGSTLRKTCYWYQISEDIDFLNTITYPVGSHDMKSCFQMNVGIIL